MTWLRPGDRLPIRDVTSLQGTAVVLPLSSHRLTHLVIRRFFGCPVCILHVREMASRHGELQAAGVGTVVVFGSSREEMLPYHQDLPFVMVPDADHVVRTACGVTSTWGSVLHPGSWGAAMRGMVGFRTAPLARGDHLALPANFLVDGDGVVVAAKYGVHADDQWSVDEVLALAR